MYAFPKIELPAKFIAEAESKGAVPDAYYCSQLLEATGICVVPGSGFRQKVIQYIPSCNDTNPSCTIKTLTPFLGGNLSLPDYNSTPEGNNGKICDFIHSLP